MDIFHSFLYVYQRVTSSLPTAFHLWRCCIPHGLGQGRRQRGVTDVDGSAVSAEPQRERLDEVSGELETQIQFSSRLPPWGIPHVE